MNDPSPSPPRIADPAFSEETLQRHWVSFALVGLALFLLGMFLVIYAATTTIASMLLFGWLLLGVGIVQAVHAFWRKRWNGFFVDLLTGIFYLFLGILILFNPTATAAALTLLIAFLLLAEGVFRIMAAVGIRPYNWGWLVLAGVISLLLGIMILIEWPVSGLWVIGLFIGIHMAFNGWSMLMLGLVARSLRTP